LLDGNGEEAMPDIPPPISDYSAEPLESPLHGYRGDSPGAPFLPAGLTIALSREAGSRGTSIAKRAAEKLGWQIYTQDVLEYLAQSGNGQEELGQALTPAMKHWVEEEMQRLRQEMSAAWPAGLFDMAGILLTLAAAGEVVLIGRGAGCILPAHSTLHVRVMAAFQDRVAYMAQWLRLTPEEAAEQVRLRDARRADYLRSHFGRDIADVYQYDLLLNSSLLGEEMSADLLAEAARAKAPSVRADRFR
jgi:cytidylate kinase